MDAAYCGVGEGRTASCGLQRANWTYAELAAYLYQQSGITGRVFKVLVV